MLIAVLAYLGPPIWAYFAIEADAKAQLTDRGWVCGNPMIGIICLAGVASSVLSLAAAGFGVASFCAMPRPRPKVRVAELGFLLFPFLIAGGYVLLLLCS